MNFRQFLTSACVLFAAGTLSADIVKPVGVTTNITGDAGSSHLYLLDDNPGFAAPGLQDEFGTAVTINTADTLVKAACTFGALGGSGHQESWTFSTPGGNPIFVFDLGADTDIGSIVLWQYGNAGGDFGRNGNHTRDFELIFHTEAEGNVFDFGTESVEYGATMEPGTGNGPGEATALDNPAQVFFFGQQINTRYVALRIANNYLPPADPIIIAGGDRYGLGEVRFATEETLDPIIAVPGPIEVNNNGTTESFFVEVFNAGSEEDLVVTDAIVTGFDATAFTILTDFDLPLSISPDSSEDIEIELNPGALTPGFPSDAALEIFSNGSIKPFISIPILALVRDPWMDDTPAVVLGPLLPTAGPQAFTIAVTNLGATQDLIVDGAFAPFGPEFTLVDDLTANPLMIPPGGTGQINLSFNSLGAAGEFNDNIEIFSNDSLEFSRIIDLQALVERDPEISPPTVVNIGPFPSGSGAQSFTIYIANLGLTNDLILTSPPALSGGDAINFTVDSFDTPIGAQGIGQIEMTFDPVGGVGNFSTSLFLESNDLGSPFGETITINAVVELPALPGGLVAWWKLDDPGNPGLDSTGNGFDGVLNGFVVDCPGANGTTGSSLEFDGSSGIDVPWDANLNPDSFTITLWANPSVTGGAHRSPITSRDDSPGATQGYIIYNTPSGVWSFWTGDGNPGWDTLDGPPGTALVWTHLAISYDATTGTKTLYVNGAPAVTDTAPNQYAPNGPQMEALHIGAGGDLGNEFRFSGKIDDVALFKTALSVDDIGTIMDDGVDGFLNPTTQLELVVNGYNSGTGELSISVNNIPAGPSFHVRSSTDGENFDGFPVDSFDSTTSQPFLLNVDPNADPLLLLQVFEGQAPL